MVDLNDLIEEETIQRWIDAQATLKAVKEEEMELRKEICAALQEVEKGHGTKSFHVQGFDLKATFSLNYKLDEEMYVQNASKMNNSELDCINIKYSLNNAKFKEIDSELLNSMVTVTEAAPTLKVKD